MNKMMDPHAIHTRMRLMDAFHQLLHTKDFDQISIKDITDIATVNRATLYAHFLDQ